MYTGVGSLPRIVLDCRYLYYMVERDDRNGLCYVEVQWLWSVAMIHTSRAHDSTIIELCLRSNVNNS